VTMHELSPGGREFVLALADDEHLVGARHTTWIGMGPFLEEDLAFCSIAQDELGHSINLYRLLTDDVDRFALLRAHDEYRSCWLAERACDDWDEALARHWLYDTAEELRWRDLLDSSNPELAALSRRALREEEFHRRHAEQLLDRVLDGTGEARDRVRGALERLLPLAPGLWDPVAGEPDAVADRTAPTTSAELGVRHRALVEDRLRHWGLDLTWPTAGPDQAGRTVRSPGFATFHASLTEVLDLDRSATW
jgi:ring-1,2-phenylacetyl-CoA epoxidase subunit PaaC